jgi:hypothetical protein
MALSGGIVLEEALDLSSDRLLMMMRPTECPGSSFTWIYFTFQENIAVFTAAKLPHTQRENKEMQV